MKTLSTITLLFISILTYGQTKSDTLVTEVTFSNATMKRFKDLEDRQRSIDSTFYVQKQNVLSIVLEEKNIDVSKVVGIVPKGNGKFIIKTKK